jgi:hypothetical protein
MPPTPLPLWWLPSSDACESGRREKMGPIPSSIGALTLSLPPADETVARDTGRPPLPTGAKALPLAVTKPFTKTWREPPLPPALRGTKGAIPPCAK